MADAQKNDDQHAEPVKFKLNGEEIEVPAGTNLIEAARSHGVRIPHFCYHPGLSPAGNCRMCLVEASNSRKPIAACTTPVTEGLEIFTETKNIIEAREGVLEFLLINHPLDCPICDKSGECLLQDNAFDHGADRSRMVEPKVLKETKELGNGIHLWGNRCILCTRCVRFCEEISGTGELCVVERGDRSIIDVAPGYPLQNSLSGNVVDICPVGALISKDFLYQARVWYQKKTQSICTVCARGCNIEIHTLGNTIKRLVPRHNPAVNDYWMCDHGRHDFKYVLGEKRCLSYRLGSSTAPASAARFILEGLVAVKAAHGAESISGVASAFMTLEELYLFRRIFEALGVPRKNLSALVRPPGKEEVFKSGFRISSDKNPNRAGLERLLGPEIVGLRSVLDRLDAGEIKALVVVSDRPHVPLGTGPEEQRLLSLLPKLEFFVVFQLETGAPLPPFTAVLPATTFSEKEGTLLNEDGRIQRLRVATQLPRGILPEHEVFQDILGGLGCWDRRVSPSGVFQELARELQSSSGPPPPTEEKLGGAPRSGPGGLSYREIGSMGIQLAPETGASRIEKRRPS